MLDLLPEKVSISVFEDELEAANCWAERHEIQIVRNAALEIRVLFVQPETELRFHLRGQFESYKAIPPAWEFMDEHWSEISKCHMPSSVASGIFHGNGLVCAHFNRMAYKSFNSNGPHANWGELTSWETAGKSSEVKGRTISDMLQCIKRDLYKSRGQMK